MFQHLWAHTKQIYFDGQHFGYFSLCFDTQPNNVQVLGIYMVPNIGIGCQIHPRIDSWAFH